VSLAYDPHLEKHEAKALGIPFRLSLRKRNFLSLALSYFLKYLSLVYLVSLNWSSGLSRLNKL
jgi:hypothetical protein